MEAGLSDTQRRIVTTAREFARDELAPSAAAREAAAEFPYGVLNRLADLGLMGIPFPEEHGGAGLDVQTLAMVVAELASADPAVALTVASHTWLGAMPIHLWGTEDQREFWMPQLCSGARLASLALTDLSSRQESAPSAWLGDRRWALNGPAGTAISAGTVSFACLVVAAQTSAAGEPAVTSLLIVPAETPGLAPGEGRRIEGFGAADVRGVEMRDCRIPEAALLGEPGAGTAAVRYLLEGSHLGMAAAAIGEARGAEGAARSSAAERARDLLLNAAPDVGAEAASTPPADAPAPAPGPAPISPQPLPQEIEPAPVEARALPPGIEPAPVVARPQPRSQTSQPVAPGGRMVTEAEAEAEAAIAPGPVAADPPAPTPQLPPAPAPGPRPLPAARPRRSRKQLVGRLPSDRITAIAGLATGAVVCLLLLVSWQL